MPEASPVYALNLFDLADPAEYREYARLSRREVERHGGTVIALGHFHERVEGEVEPRQVMILVEWQSVEAFEDYRDDPALTDLHARREAGAANYVWMLFDRLEDLRPVLG